jgi:hypothetical protein
MQFISHEIDAGRWINHYPVVQYTVQKFYDIDIFELAALHLNPLRMHNDLQAPQTQIKGYSIKMQFNPVVHTPSLDFTVAPGQHVFQRVTNQQIV